MWRMLCASAGSGLTVRLVESEADGQAGTAHWLADYTFTQTDRKVHKRLRHVTPTIQPSQRR